MEQEGHTAKSVTINNRDIKSDVFKRETERIPVFVVVVVVWCFSLLFVLFCFAQTNF